MTLGVIPNAARSRTIPVEEGPLSGTLRTALLIDGPSCNVRILWLEGNDPVADIAELTRRTAAVVLRGSQNLIRPSIHPGEAASAGINIARSSQSDVLVDDLPSAAPCGVLGLRHS